MEILKKIEDLEWQIAQLKKQAENEASAMACTASRAEPGAWIVTEDERKQLRRQLGGKLVSFYGRRSIKSYIFPAKTVALGKRMYPQVPCVKAEGLRVNLYSYTPEVTLRSQIEHELVTHLAFKLSNVAGGRWLIIHLSKHVVMAPGVKTGAKYYYADLEEPDPCRCLIKFPVETSQSCALRMLYFSDFDKVLNLVFSRTVTRLEEREMMMVTRSS